MPAAMAGMRSAEVVELLARVPVLSTLMTEDLERIADLAVPRAFEPGQVVFREGDASDTCYIVRSGRARAVREHAGGRTITLATFGPGDIFGELALFEDERRSATIEAIEQCSVVAVLGPDMRRLMIEHPGISARLVIALGRRLRETNERLTRQSFQTVQSRVAVVLSELVAQELAAQEEGQREQAGREKKGGQERGGQERGGQERGGQEKEGHGGQGGQDKGALEKGEQGEGEQEKADGDVLVTATQADLAQLAGSSRESASRFLAVLERAGVISQGRGRLVVHDREALKQYVF
jgi:CRP/FNR family cyclic AMP-dependent transcriptional regulator